jgi:hypothetical protein
MEIFLFSRIPILALGSTLPSIEKVTPAFSLALQRLAFNDED